MGTTTVPLIDGLKMGDVPQLDAVIRDANAGDIIEATVESEKVFLTPDGYQLIASPTMVSAGVLCRQIVNIGKIQGPLTLAQISLLSPIDLDLLNVEADKLEQAALAVAQRGRSDSDGAASGTGSGDSVDKS